MTDEEGLATIRAMTALAGGRTVWGAFRLANYKPLTNHDAVSSTRFAHCHCPYCEAPPELFWPAYIEWVAERLSHD